MVYGVCMKRKQVMITEDIDYRVTQLVDQGKAESFSSVVREALSVYIAEIPKKNKKNKPKNALQSMRLLMKKAYQGGPKDLSTNDSYLYGPKEK